MRLVIIGDGLLGQTLMAAHRSDPRWMDLDHVILLPHAAIDLLSPDSVRRALREHKPDVVVNTAAVHSLVVCELDPDRAYALNARAQDRLARIVPTLFISTDYVFNDGGPHTEDMPGQQPRSVYGRSKLAGELATLEHGGAVARVASLYGHFDSHKGPSFPQTILSSHSPIRLPTDQVMSPTYAPDAATQILRVAQMMAEGTHYKGQHAIFHATNRGSASWAHFAEHILSVTGHDRHVLPYQAKDTTRPSDSSLRNTRLPQTHHWMRGLSAWAQAEGRQRIVSPRR